MLIKNNVLIEGDVVEYVGIIPDGVTEIGEFAFSDEDLSDVFIPSSVTKIGAGAFYNSGLSSINIPASVTEIGDYAFACCESLFEATVSDNLEVAGKGIFDGSGELKWVWMTKRVHNAFFKDLRDDIVRDVYRADVRPALR